MTDPIFLEIEQVLYIQKFEAEMTNSPTIIRDVGALEASLAALNHPFLDGNKRTALGTGLAFLPMNGFLVKEKRDEELADLLLGVLEKSASKDDLANYFRDRSIKRST